MEKQQQFYPSTQRKLRAPRTWAYSIRTQATATHRRLRTSYTNKYKESITPTRTCLCAHSAQVAEIGDRAEHQRAVGVRAVTAVRRAQPTEATVATTRRRAAARLADGGVTLLGPRGPTARRERRRQRGGRRWGRGRGCKENAAEPTGINKSAPTSGSEVGAGFHP